MSPWPADGARRPRGGASRGSRGMGGSFGPGVSGGTVDVSRGRALEARTRHPLGENQPGVQGSRLSRAIRKILVDDDERSFGACHGVPGDGPQLLHRQPEVPRVRPHPCVFRMITWAGRSGLGTPDWRLLDGWTRVAGCARPPNAVRR